MRMWRWGKRYREGGGWIGALVKVQLLVWAGLVPCRGMPAVLYFLAGDLYHMGTQTRDEPRTYIHTYILGEAWWTAFARNAVSNTQEDLGRTYK